MLFFILRHQRALEKSALALEETIEEMEDEKKESSDETFAEESKTEELSVGPLNPEFEVTEPSEEIMEEKVQDEAVEKENKESETAIENNVDIEQNEKVEVLESEHNNIHEDVDTDAIEKEETQIPAEAEILETENVGKFFENIKIKEEPIDEPEEPLEEPFDFSNVVIKEEPVEPEPGTYYAFTISRIVKFITTHRYYIGTCTNFVKTLQNNFASRP